MYTLSANRKRSGLALGSSVAVDTAGNLYVTDQDNNRVLKLPVA